MTSDYLHHNQVNRMQKGAHFVERPLFPRDSRTMVSGESLSSFFEAQTNKGNQWIEFSTDPISLLLHLIKLKREQLSDA